MTSARPYANLPDPDRQSGFYAGVPVKRFFAFLIDLVIILALSIGVALLSFGIFFFLFILVFTCVGFIYRVLTLSSGSATLGMRLMGIELRSYDGGRFSFADAFLHTLAFYISFGMFPLQAISIVLMFTTPRGQGLTDFLFGTVALNKAAGG